MREKSPFTPRSQIKNILRKLWLQSRERAAAMKRTKYCCEKCKVKMSKAKGKEQKVEVHHKEGVGNWNKVIAVIREQLLCDPELLTPLCPNCHAGIDPHRHITT